MESRASLTFALLLCAATPCQNLAVLDVTPSANSTSASASAQVEVTFDRAVDPATLAGAVRMTGRWSGEVPLQTSLDASGLVLESIDQRRPGLVASDLSQ